MFKIVISSFLCLKTKQQNAKQLFSLPSMLLPHSDITQMNTHRVRRATSQSGGWDHPGSAWMHHLGHVVSPADKAFENSTSEMINNKRQAQIPYWWRQDRKSMVYWRTLTHLIFYGHISTAFPSISPRRLAGTKRTARGVCSPAVPPGWSGPAPHGCSRPAAPPLSGPGSNTASQSQRMSACGQSHHSDQLELVTWPEGKTEGEGWGWWQGWVGGGERKKQGMRKIWGY